MLKLMIVDDEAIIVKGLQHVIRRMKTPFTDIVGVSDSVEALRMAEEFKPDLLITDIQMPELSGLDLIQSVSEKKAASKFIILTGYETFDYARKAIRLQVADYLLKPVDPQELSGLLNRLSMEIVEERSRGQAATDTEEPTEDQDSNHNIRRFKDFIHGNYMRDISLEDVADYLNLHPSYVCSLLKRETHQTFVQYLRGFRINKGKKLLRELPNLPLEQVAKAIGFRSQAHFYKVFKQESGVTPGDYRNMKD
ncbi:response regulator [Paenibacillus macerans]|uniref:response regulator transcription factor n=1 Tax=Paenibacillus macerans TaxID=44252 RepID=UPI002E1E3DA4|nr:response regulator [Paenibacillus macerans]MED4954004.1 response regulator [Paenibacillus macerans]